MSKTLLYRLFRAGAVPAAQRADLEREGILVLDEGVPGSTTLIGFRARWRRHAWKRSWISGAVVVTRERVAAYAFSRRILDIPRAEAAARKIEVAVEPDGGLLLAFDTSRLAQGAQGRVELRYATDMADRVVEKLRGR